MTEVPHGEGADVATKTELNELKAKDNQRKRASLDMLLKKRRVEKEIAVSVLGDDGEAQELVMLFRAIGSMDYDRLLSKYPPSAKQREEGSNYDIDKFGPALIAACCVDPPLSMDDANTLWNSEEWNRGEIMRLFFGAVEVCTQGLEIPPTGSG